MTTTPVREAGLFLALSYTLALVVALSLPNSELAPMLTVLTPLLSVAVVGVTLVRRGNRKTFWAGLGLQRAGFRWWLIALAVPPVITIVAYAVASALGVAELRNPENAAAGSATTASIF
jgi:uncharacterized protein